MRYDWQGRLQLATNVSYQDTRDQQKYKGDGKPSATYNNRVPHRPWLFGSVEAYYTFRNIAPVSYTHLAVVLLHRSGQEAGNIFEGYQRDVEAVAETNRCV